MRAFLDTNILVYAFTEDRRSEKARSLLHGAVVGVQNLNEFASVALRKLRWDWSDIRFALDRIARLCELGSPIDLTIHRAGVAIAEKYRLGIYDALLIAAALESSCDVAWSEDMHDGLLIEGRLTIRNPFAV